MIVDIVHTNDFKEKVKDGAHLIDFWAPWCGPCRMLSSVLEEVSSSIKNGEIDKIQAIIKINVDEAGELASSFEIQSVPSLIIFKDGIEVARKTGFISKSAITTWLNEKL